MHLKVLTYTLELQHTFSISRESHNTQDTVITCLEKNGQRGYGEATTNPYYGITRDSLVRELNALTPQLANYEFQHPEKFHRWLQQQGLSQFALCAMDLAGWDLYGKLLGKPLYEIWETSITSYPTTNYTIGLDTPEKMVAKIQEKPWPLYKIKLGTKNDLELIRELRKHTDAIFRVDANCAWTAEQTIEFSEALKVLGVEFIEQPLPAQAWEGMEKVIHNSALPIIADESCIREEDVVRCALHFSGINIKLTKCGGLTPALRMIRQAKNLGQKVMVGCMTESTVGISAIAQLLPQLDYVDMDGALLLKSDIASGVKITEKAEVIFPALPGSGIELWQT